MELNYRYALVSFCPDLTNPNSPSLPVALLMIAVSGDEAVAAATGWYPRDSEDPLSSALLKDMPRFLRAHVDEVWSNQNNVDAEELLVALQHSLRNTVHVSCISQPMTETVSATAPEDLGTAVSSKAISLFFKAMRDAGMYLLEQNPAPINRGDRLPRVPPLEIWPLLSKPADEQRLSLS